MKKNKLKDWYFLISGLIVISALLYTIFTNEHMKDRTVKTLVLYKIDEDVMSKGRHTGNDYYLILQADSVKFDLLVDRTTYYEAELGNYLYFDLNDSQMGLYDSNWQVLYWFLTGIFFIITFIQFSIMFLDQ